MRASISPRNIFALLPFLTSNTQGVYNRAVGPVSVVFLAVLACTCGYRRQAHSPVVEVEEVEEAARIQSMRPGNVSTSAAENKCVPAAFYSLSLGWLDPISLSPFGCLPARA